MQQIEQGILFEDSYLGVTLGALIYPHGIIIIDAPLRAEDARSWRSSLINQRGGPNRILVCLDSHPDRTLGARALECSIIAHQKAAQVFRNRPTIFKGQSLETGAVWETYGDAIGMRWVSPDITFSERMFLHWGGPDVVLEYRPGPTQGAIWVSIPDERVVFVGDAVLRDQPPFLAQADLEAWVDNLDVLLDAYRGYVIVSGRNGTVNTNDVRKQQKILKKIISGLERLSQDDSPPEATQSLIPGILSNFKFTQDSQDLYTKRLRQGLYQCFVHRYRLLNIAGQSEDEEETE
jgi:glyoxylase-like metal-dependent hydrolase (beta-lactamase superfamily II)